MTTARPIFAGANLRAAALVLDGLIVCLLLLASAFTLEVMLQIKPQPFFWALIVAYYVMLPATRWQGTIGKRANRLRIATLAGERIGIGRSAVRFAAGLLSWATLGAGFIVCLWNPRRRTLHDYVAGTVVVDAGATPAQVAAAVPPPVPWPKRILGSLVMALGIGLPLVLFFEGMNARVAWQRNARNQQAAERVVVALEQYRSRNGRFPAKLSELGIERPKLEDRTVLHYAASGPGDQCWLAIVYWLRAGLLPSDDVKEYDCAARVWTVKDYTEMKAAADRGF